ncbi:MAG: WecB/TagA/CpsF family glycosyltransferase [Bacilli bacterium]|nr:WecB/TagA/CpsF family glycosyltransferase [Bacilli bacterium]
MKEESILGVNIAVTNMQKTVNFIINNIDELSGKYICVSNVHTTVMSYENEEYKNVQNSAILRLPDGKPLSIVQKKRGFKEAERVTGPDLMQVLFEKSSDMELHHYFYGSTDNTLELLRNNLKNKYHDIKIAGMYSPPFRNLSKDEDEKIIEMINSSGADIVWVGLGAPKQEKWMYDHKDKIRALMIGVGAGFDYHAGNIKRAPKWMQKCSLEWLYRLLQDPKRLFKRYFKTNLKFIRLVSKENKNGKL